MKYQKSLRFVKEIIKSNFVKRKIIAFIASTIHKRNIYDSNTHHFYHLQCFWLDTSKLTIFRFKF